MEEFLTKINQEVQQVISSEFEIETKEVSIVPSLGDTDLTYSNFNTNHKRGKIIKTCVLYIDIRKSTEISLSHYSETLSKLYSAFVRSMVKSSEYFGGKVRNIIGDRVMVIFDEKDCFKNAVNTAILLNSVSQYIINKNFKKNEIKCGIGIDYGKMLVLKTGGIKQGKENSEYKALVWVGKPANIASKLTDIASKKVNVSRVKVTYEYIPIFTILDMISNSHPLRYGLSEEKKPIKTTENVSFYEFTKELSISEYDGSFRYKNGKLLNFNKIEKQTKTPPILLSQKVYEEFKKGCPDCNSIKKNWWNKQELEVKEYNSDIWGGDIIWTSAKNI